MATIQKTPIGTIVNFKVPITISFTDSQGPFNKKIYYKSSNYVKYIHKLSEQDILNMDQVNIKVRTIANQAFVKGHLGDECPMVYDIVSHREDSDVVFLPLKKELAEKLKKPATIEVECKVSITGLTVKSNIAYMNYHTEYKFTEAEAIEM